MPNIKYRISLEGGEQVKSELLTVEQAVKRLQDAAKSGTGADTFASTTAAISKLGSTTQEALGAAAAAAQKFGASANELARVEGIIKALDQRARDGGSSFQSLAQNYDKARASAMGLGQAVAGQAAAHGRFAESTEQVATGSRQATAAMRLLGAEVRTVGAALASAGAPIGGVAASFASLGAAATGMGPVLGTIAVAVAGISTVMIGGVAALAKFAEGAKETVTALGRISEKGGSSFEFVGSMQQAFARGGVSLKEFTQSYENFQQKLAQARPTALTDLAASADKAAGATQSVASAQLALGEAAAKASSATGQLSEAEQQYFDEARRGLAVRQAAQQLKAAEREEAIADANNLETLAGKYKQLANGVQQTFNPLTTLESKAKALTAMLAGGGKSLGSFDEFLKDTGTTAAKDAQAFLKLADVLKNIKDESERMQLGKAMGFSPAEIQTLSLGSEALKRIQNEVKSLGLELSKPDRLNLQQFKEAQSTLGAVFDALKDKMGALAAPAFTSFFEGLTERLKELSPAFQELARMFGELDFRSLGQTIADIALKFGELALKIAQAIQAVAGGDFSALETLLSELGTKIEQLGKSAGGAFINGFKAALVESLTGDDPFNMAALSQKLIQFFKQLKFSDLFGVGKAGAGEAGGGQLGGADYGPMIAGAEVAAVRIKQIFTDAFSQSMTMDFSSIITAAQTAATEIQLLFSTASEQLTETFSSIDISSALAGQIDALITKFNELAIAATAAAAAAAGAAGGGGGAPTPAPVPLAGGGLFGGRGTGTSDSNLAWLSRGEHIMPARAVRQPGVLAFLEALRRSGGNLADVLDGMGRFALGGMVPRAIPAFAAGGLNRGMSNVTIQFPGLPAIGGLRASSDVVDQLHKAAALAQVRSGGRKPSRYS